MSSYQSDFLSTIYNKRFCQSTGKTTHSGHYNHVSCIFEGKIENLCQGNGKQVRIHSYGMNRYTGPHDIMSSVHAEHDAIMKLKPLERKKNKQKCSMFITRLSKTGKLGTSKPCSMCINNMYFMPEQKGYKIHHVYYTDQHENIIRTTLTRLLQENETYYTSGYLNQTVRRADPRKHKN